MCADSPPEARLRTCTESEGPAIEHVLRVCFPDAPDLADLWSWKHQTRPGSRPEEILVGELDGRIVGCFHFTVLPLQLGDGCEIPASWDADFGVLPEARGFGLSARAYALSDRSLVDRGVPIRGGFAGNALNAKVHGNVVVPSTAITFRKVIGLAALRARVETIGKSAAARPWLGRALDAREHVIDVQIDGLPPCNVRLTGSGFFLDPGLAGSKMAVKAPYSLLLALNRGTLTRLRALAFGLTTGQLRIRGVGRWMPLVIGLLVGFLRRG